MDTITMKKVTELINHRKYSRDMYGELYGDSDWNASVQPCIVSFLNKSMVFDDIETIKMFKDNVIPHIRNLEEIQGLLNKRFDEQIKQLKSGKKPEAKWGKVSKELIEEIAGLPDVNVANMIHTYKHKLMDDLFRQCILNGANKFVDMAAYEAFMKLIWPCRNKVMNDLWVKDMEQRLLPKVYEELKNRTLNSGIEKPQKTL